MPDDSTTIQIRVERTSQLINMLDPFPFRERDLDPQAEDYIVGWARELPRTRPISIVVHLPEDEARSASAQAFPATLHHFFSERSQAVSRELKELLRIGRLSLLVGLAVLALCMLLAQIVSGRFEGTFGSFVEESLIIVGWVANWRPLEIFLYDWWPLVRQRNLYRRLAEAEVTITGQPGAPQD
ncbi:hypothetical protein ABLE91_19300 [Aquabacter sp. CN5-332]|uniref:hypothetical protein n=1 Tax=Aquabacter sp. CN5-332 TaxID=3156608 RepID=UPI0032B51157